MVDNIRLEPAPVHRPTRVSDGRLLGWVKCWLEMAVDACT